MPPTGDEPGERSARLELVAAGARLSAAGLLLPGEGNLSRRSGAGGVLITPRGADKGRLAARDLVRVALDAHRPAAGVSTELRMHLAVYRRRFDIAAVIHAHPRATLALAALRRIPRVDLLEEGELLVGDVALVDFAPSGSADLAEAVASALETAPACVIERHGAVTVAAEVELAVRRILLLERLSELTLAGG